jgi:8-oxo-dGTP pyrophosphatase MutT (NUDIX family)
VLLIKRRGFWDIPKGKLDAGESIQQCAAREVMEEIGLEKLPMILGDLGKTIHQYEEKGEMIEKTTHWYLMYTTEKTFIPQASEQIEQVKWEKLDNAFNKVQFDNLRVVLERVRNRFISY